MEVTQLWEQLNGELTGYLRGITKNVETAEDIAAETFLKALSHQTLLSSMAPVQCKVWLYHTARHIAIDQARRHRSEARLEPTRDYVEEDFTKAEVAELIAMLPEALQELFAMRYLAGMDSRQIGESLHIPAATVRTRLRKACILLRQIWDKE
jgi:RNA polymerase sigma-70 factor (ECF subfamily)